MVKVSHEVPICLLNKSRDFNEYDYCLPHLLDKNLEINLNNEISKLNSFVDNKGNPYELDQDGDRDTVCDSFEHYFKRKYGLHKELHTLKGKVLGCWCYPKRCHGNHLKKLADDTNEV